MVYSGQHLSELILKRIEQRINAKNFEETSEFREPRSLSALSKVLGRVRQRTREHSANVLRELVNEAKRQESASAEVSDLDALIAERFGSPSKRELGEGVVSTLKRRRKTDVASVRATVMSPIGSVSGVEREAIQLVPATWIWSKLGLGEVGGSDLEGFAGEEDRVSLRDGALPLPTERKLSAKEGRVVEGHVFGGGASVATSRTAPRQGWPMLIAARPTFGTSPTISQKDVLMVQSLRVKALNRTRDGTRVRIQANLKGGFLRVRGTELLFSDATLVASDPIPQGVFPPPRDDQDIDREDISHLGHFPEAQN